MKRKVLQLIGSFNQGGSERQAVQLARLLHEDGRYEIHVACMDAAGVLREDVDRLGLVELPEYRLTSFYNWNAVVQVRRFARLLRDREIDIIHTHDFYTNVFGMAAARLARVPVRIASRRETIGWRIGAQKTVERFAYRFAHAIVANSEAVRLQLSREGVSPDKVVTVYNGLDLKRVSPKEGCDRQAALGLPHGLSGPFVTILANLRNEVKDHATFLRAAARVHKKIPGARFIIAGEGELMAANQALAAALGLGDAAHFIGRCEHVAELLALSDVCVLSSKAEGFSNSILEYMAAGRPVVTTEAGGAREAVIDGESGFVVRAGDDETMAARIVLLLNDKDRAQVMGDKGRLIVEHSFSCATQLERTTALYERLLPAPDSTSARELRRKLAVALPRKHDSSPLKRALSEGAEGAEGQPHGN
jgi:glycosyltransferase involved in cell wall biosynthesis